MIKASLGKQELNFKHNYFLSQRNQGVKMLSLMECQCRAGGDIGRLVWETHGKRKKYVY